MNRELMNYLGVAEGTKIHYNKGENDITTMFGIYRRRHPSAAIFERIDSLASTLYLPKNTAEWNSDHLEVINHAIDTRGLSEEFVELANEFYKGYMALPLDIFPEKSQVAVFSMYTNSPKFAQESFQEAINLFDKNGFISLDKPLLMDGDFGNNSKRALEKVVDFTKNDIYTQYLFESYILLAMSKRYAILVQGNQEKYLRWLRGWNNRLIHLASI